MNLRHRVCEHCGGSTAGPWRNRIEVDVGVAAGVSDRGLRRHRNEDSLALRDVGRGDSGSAQRGVAVAVVCDGVSSSARSDEASEVAAEVAAEILVSTLCAGGAPAAATCKAIRAADRAVAELVASDRAGFIGAGSPGSACRGAPACTFVSAIVTGDTVTVGWVGDSRAYWIPQTHVDPAPTRLTTDDSWLAQVLAAGTLSRAQAANDRRAHAITAWLGGDAEQIDPHVVTIEPEGSGVVVVCTDGLWHYLDHVAELAAAIPAHAADAPLDAARRLVEIALDRGGRDNITVAVLPYAGS